MIRFFIYVLLFSLTVIGKVAAEGMEMSGQPEKTTVTERKATDDSPENKQEAEITLKAYSMNSVLFIETNSEEAILIFTEAGDLKEEITPTGSLIALPMSRGTYMVKTGNLSRRVIVR